MFIIWVGKGENGGKRAGFCCVMGGDCVVLWPNSAGKDDFIVCGATNDLLGLNC